MVCFRVASLCVVNASSVHLYINERLHAGMVNVRSALFRYYTRIPSTDTLTSSSGLTPAALLSRSLPSSNSELNVACTKSIGNISCRDSGGMSICDNSRKKKATSEKTKRRRSNLTIALLNADGFATTSHSTLLLQSDSIIEVIAHSSDGSTTIVESLESAEAARARKEKGKLPIIEEVNDYSEDDFVADVKEKVTKKNYDATRKFQDTWAARLLWTELFRGSNGLFEYVKCVVCSLITEKPKILGPKWDTLSKHRGKRKATRNMPNGIKKGQWYIAKNCKHLRYERIYVAKNNVNVAQQLAVVKGEQARKRLQFATILHLLQEGCPMLEYAALQPLLSFLEVPKLPSRHWADNAG